MQNRQRLQGPTPQTRGRPLGWVGQRSTAREGTSAFPKTLSIQVSVQQGSRSKGCLCAAESRCMLKYSREETLTERGEGAIASSARSVLPKAALRRFVSKGRFSSALPPAGPVPVFKPWSHTVPERGKNRCYLLHQLQCKHSRAAQSQPRRGRRGARKRPSPRQCSSLPQRWPWSGMLAATCPCDAGGAYRHETRLTPSAGNYCSTGSETLQSSSTSTPLLAFIFQVCWRCSWVYL